MGSIDAPVQDVQREAVRDAVIAAARGLAAHPEDKTALFELRLLLALEDEETARAGEGELPEPEYVADPLEVIVPEYEEET